MPDDSALAIKLWRASQERTAMLDIDSALVLLKRAHRADPAFLPAELDLMRALGERVYFAERRRIVLGGIGDRALAACLDAIAAARPAPAVVAMLRGAEKHFGPTPCTTTFLAVWGQRLPPADRSPPPRLEDWMARTRRLLADDEPWNTYIVALAAARDSAAADRALSEALRHVEGWQPRISLTLLAAEMHRARGDTAGAELIRERVTAAVTRDGRPGVLLHFLAQLIPQTTNARLRDSLTRVSTAIARRFAPRPLLAGELAGNGYRALDRGNVAEGITWLTEATALADSVGWPSLRARMRLRLGRALLKQGRTRAAIGELRTAITLVDPDDRYTLADAHHNLAHAYESLGDLTTAVREVRTFARLATPFRDDGLAIISRFDAGLILWKTGLHASSRNSFDEMVRIIDEQRAYYYYAGEYYERIGDRARARAYYERVPAYDTEEGARALAGLTRSFEALGMLDSAEAGAPRHDAAPVTPEEIPLLPGVLARKGRVDEARRALADWIARQSAGGGAPRIARATLELSRILIDARAYEAGAAQARRAEQVARSANLVEERARALTLEARILLASDRADSAVRVMEGVVALLGERPPPDLVVEAQHTLGRALAACGRRDEALRAFDIAARTTDRVAASFDDDLDRVRLRAERLASFDDAVRMLAEAGDAARVVQWSQRRKETTNPGEGDAPTLLSLRDIQSRLSATTAVVDYTILDSAAFAVVITKRGATMLPIAASRARMASVAAELRRPMSAYMGRVDLSRLSFDRGRAAELHAALVAPLLSRLHGISHLVVVPDGPLHLVPFDALIGPRGFLIDEYEIAYLPSMRFLGAEVRSSLRGTPVLVVGYDAVGDSAEWRGIVRAWRNGSVRALLGKDATKSAMQRATANANILHFAAHAHASPSDPLGAYLRLSPGSGDDGMLHLAEVERLKVASALVVLSACETDDGMVLRGAGPLGLSRAFLVAGAHAVVGTQWPIGATAVPLMTAFYTRLADGKSPSAALRDAQLAIKSDPRTANPFYWAGFTLTER